MHARVMTRLFLALAGAACGPIVEEVEQAGSPLIVPDARVAGDFGRLGGSYFLSERYLTFTGPGSRIKVVRTQNGVWQAPQEIPGEETAQGASLIPFNGSLFLTFFDASQKFTSLKSTDGVNWGDRRTLTVRDEGGQRVFAAPAMVLYGNRLNAFLGLGPADTINWNTWGAIRQLLLESDGSWRTVDLMTGVTPGGGISAAVLGDKLVMAWNNWSVGFNTRVFTPGMSWGPINKFNRFQGHLFTALSLPETLLWVQRDTAPNNQNWITIDKTDGVSFTRFKDTGHASKRPPFGLYASQFDEVIQFAHVGTDGNQSLNFTEIPWK